MKLALRREAFTKTIVNVLIGTICQGLVINLGFADPVLSRRVQIHLSDEPPLSADPHAIAYNYPRHQTIRINPTMLGSCLALTTSQYSNYSIDRRLENGGSVLNTNFFAPYVQGHDRNYDLSTRFIDQLRLWTLHQPDNSISPVNFYRQSLLLAQGNVFSAIVAIHQLIRNEARWWVPSRYQYESNSANQHEFFNKLIDLRGDLEERGPHFYGDHAGTWYRIWGVYLYQLANLSEHVVTNLVRPSNGAICRLSGPDRTPHGIINSQSPFEDLFGYISLEMMEWGKLSFLPAPLAAALNVEDRDARKSEINRGALTTINAMIYQLYYQNYGVTEQECRSRSYLLPLVPVLHM